ncbi:hypothetical protein Pden_0806 [Paracoccus denitrificans PD1222]|uniref:Uncharacterized protein n=1 Tax=Paracoccus denitrificans (strain Pd 1222) TaxID=318586 RepID=A1B074_PARDP|nr:hypothetical protein Pden_0806 [Paracoccus denitrificans PD1222]
MAAVTSRRMTRPARAEGGQELQAPYQPFRSCGVKPRTPGICAIVTELLPKRAVFRACRGETTGFGTRAGRKAFACLTGQVPENLQGRTLS